MQGLILKSSVLLPYSPSLSKFPSQKSQSVNFPKLHKPCHISLRRKSNPTLCLKEENSVPDPSKYLPDDYLVIEDWPSKGVIPDVPDQGDMGICWALATVDALAAIYTICYGGKRPKPAVQELLDGAIWDEENGASLFNPLSYIFNFGLADETYYPFVGTRTPHKLDVKQKIMSPTQFTFEATVPVPPIAEKLIAALRFGPLVGALVIGEAYNHAVVITGCGFYKGRFALQFRNSYGTGWGNGGYGYLEMVDGSEPEKKLFLTEMEGSKGKKLMARLLYGVLFVKNGRGLELRQKWRIKDAGHGGPHSWVRLGPRFLEWLEFGCKNK